MRRLLAGGPQCSSISFSASRRLVQLPCITAASGPCSQRTKVEATKPFCKLGSEFPHCHFSYILISNASPQILRGGEISPPLARESCRESAAIFNSPLHRENVFVKSHFVVGGRTRVYIADPRGWTARLLPVFYKLGQSDSLGQIWFSGMISSYPLSGEFCLSPQEVGISLFWALTRFCFRPHI